MGKHKIKRDLCINCGECLLVCPVKAIEQDEERCYITDRCVGCGACKKICPTEAIFDYFSQ